MESSRRRNNKNNFEIGNFDRKVDQFLEASRQFVDGVSGTRPGSKRRVGLNRFPRANVKDVGRWVSNKVDSIFDDDEFEDWNYDNVNSNQFKNFSRGVDLEPKDDNLMQKRPLESRSLREEKDTTKFLNAGDDWPEESDFKVNKWQRSDESREGINLENNSDLNRIPKTKSFPKSRRRRRI